MRIEPGLYDVKVIAATIVEAESGSVMCRMKFDNGMSGGICLVQKDGTLRERGFKDVMAILGMSEFDYAAFDVDPETLTGEAQIEVEDKEGDHGTYSSVKYINAPGGSKQLERADAKSLAAKYGAKTRALLGGKQVPAGKPAAPKSQPKPPPPAASQEPEKTSTMEECWDSFCQANSGKTELELYERWPKVIKQVTGKSQNDLTPAEWGKVFEHINSF